MAEAFDFVLEQQVGRLWLRALHHPEFGAICADWDSPDMRRRIVAGRRQLLARAIGLHRQRDLCVLDATAGLGRDGCVLAALGARVTLAERHPQVAALLRDALARGGADLELIQDDAHALLAGTRTWDVIYLDPMYPHRGKAALPAKEMQLLRELTAGDADADALLAPARARARQRVVVKRPLQAPPLAATEPAFVLKGTQARFDIYLPAV